MPDVSWLPVPESGRTLEENWLFRLRRERYRSRASGVEHDFYVMHLADSVNVVALTADRQVVLVRQFRAGSQHYSLETPGGLLGEGEDPLIAGARELLEESGYAGDPPRLLGTVWANPSIMTAKSTTILVTNVRRVAEVALDHSEEVAVELVPADEIPRMLRDGEIDHALAVQGLLWWLVSEMPGPLALPSRRASTAPSRFVMWTNLIGIGMTWLGLIASYNTDWFKTACVLAGGLVMIVLLPAMLVWLVFGNFDPPRESTLCRAARRGRWHRLGRNLTVVGR